MNSRFTIDGSEALETRLEQLCTKASSALIRIIPLAKLHAVLLGGGYGRGEGGVLKTENGDEPYNDLEFYIIHSGNSLISQRRFGAKVHHLAEQLTREAGLEVEFKLLSLTKLKESPPTMSYYDLVSGHRTVFGDDNCLSQCKHHRSAHRIPLHEATRLLMNRCSGLLYSEEKLLHSNFTNDDADFVARNCAKAKLAFGDVILVAKGLYHWSCRERNKRLNLLEPDPSLPGQPQIVAWHNEGSRFKLHPFRCNAAPDLLKPELDALKKAGLDLWLWLEQRRLNRKFADPAEYALDLVNKCPETRKWRNRLINLQRFGPAALKHSGYPRERLLNSLPLLLWVPEMTNRQELLQFGQEQLLTRGTDFSTLVGAYQKIWRNFN